MKKLILLTAIFLTSCGKHDIPREIDAYFLPFIDKFKEDADSHKITYGDINSITVMRVGRIDNPNMLSECNLHDQKDIYGHHISYKEIVEKPEIQQNPFQYQYEIFLHEMGHCAYHLSHSSDQNAIMYAYPAFMTWQIFQLSLDQYFESAQNNNQNWYSY